MLLASSKTSHSSTIDDEPSSASTLLIQQLQKTPIGPPGTLPSSRSDDPSAEVETSAFTGMTGASSAWGPWEGECQMFANRQPCLNQVMIGFETRRCFGHSLLCRGPFFRYCTLSC